MKRETGTPKHEQEIVPEYSYDEGLARSVVFITELSKKQPYVVVAFSSTGPNVGKSTLAIDIKTKLLEQNLHSTIVHDFDEFKAQPVQEQMVFIIDQMYYGTLNIHAHKAVKELHNQEVKTELGTLGYNVNGVDLCIGICTPDQPFAKSEIEDPVGPIADFVIINTKANSKGKL